MYLQPFDSLVKKEAEKLERNSHAGFSESARRGSTDSEWEGRSYNSPHSIPGDGSRQLSFLASYDYEPSSPHCMQSRNAKKQELALTQLPLLRDLQLELNLDNLDNSDSVITIGQQYEMTQLEKDFGFTHKIGRRRIPTPTNQYLVPVLRDRNLSRKAQHLGVLWYMSALIPTAHTAILQQPKTLLGDGQVDNSNNWTRIQVSRIGRKQKGGYHVAPYY